MLHQVSLSQLSAVNSFKGARQTVKNTTNPITTGQTQAPVEQQSVKKLVDAYKGYNKINLASSISFGSNFASAFDELNQAMVTCEDLENGKEGEVVGKRVDVSKLVPKFAQDLSRYEDAIKTTIQIDEGKDKDGNPTVTDARTQIKKGSDKKMKFEMSVRPPRKKSDKPASSDTIKQNIQIQLEPYRIEHDEDNVRYMAGTPENAYILNTRGNLMAIIEDGENVLLTDTGRLVKKDASQGALDVTASKLNSDGKPNKFTEYSVPEVFQVTKKSGGSQGGGTEIIIGLEDGRFVPEIIQSIEDFQEKLKKNEVVLDEFVPAPDIENVQIAMLAGGFGSRAEYANASSSKIMHGKKDGSNLTKGCFRTATGLTPMETSFISLHKAGYLDCSKENFGIGKNLKFYLNDSGKNSGNGGFTFDLFDTMKSDNTKNLLVLPNDAMSRIPVALEKVNELINSKDAAMVMIAKQVKSEDARGKLGIMKISPEGLIEEFAEKPKEFAPGYVDENDKCYANTFQFTVSKEAFEALSVLDRDGNLSPKGSKNKESRDWSKTYTPVLMAITQNDDPYEMQEQIKKSTNLELPIEDLQEAKNILGDQKIYAIKSDEPWADCGTLNALYMTTTQIAHGNFELEDFERAHVLESVNPKTGLVASTPQQKEEIEAKYDIEGQIMVVPKAKPADPDVVERNEDAITRYSSKH